MRCDQETRPALRELTIWGLREDRPLLCSDWHPWDGSEAPSSPFPSPAGSEGRVERRASAVMEVMFYFKIKHGSH